jgi:hypothetical protein
MGLISNGTTIFDAGALDSGLAKGAMTFIKKLTASSSATLSFVDGASSVVLDNTYKEYLFTFNNIHPATDNTQFAFQVDTGTNTSYNIACTSSTFRAYHNEAGNDAGLGYVTGEDQAQGTSFQKLTAGGTVGNDADQSASGYLHIFNPSSSVFVKHFICRSNAYHASDYTADFYAAGYFNTTTALTRVQFKMLSGNIDSGDICLYGIS